DVVRQAADGLGGLDALVNNAGRQIAVKDIADLTDEQWEHTFATNIHAMFRVVKAALEFLPAGSRSSIPPRCRPTHPRLTSSTTPRRRRRSTTSRRGWPHSWPRAASGSTGWLRDRSGLRCRSRTVSRRRPFA